VAHPKLYIYQWVRYSVNKPLPRVLLGNLRHIFSLSVSHSLALKQPLYCPLEHAEGVGGPCVMSCSYHGIRWSWEAMGFVLVGCARLIGVETV